MVFRLQMVSIVPANQLRFNRQSMDAVASTVGDWVRLNSNTWLVWTTYGTRETSLAFKNKLSSDDIVVVVYANPKEAAGSAPQWLWNWINQKVHMHIPH